MKAFLSLAILVGCSGGGGVTIDQLPTELAKSSCSKLSECCTAEEFKTQTLGADTEAKCEQVLGGFTTLGFGAINDSVHTGRVIYHSDKVRACLDAAAAASCVAYGADSGAGITACEGVFEPKVAIGGQCGNDIDCTTKYCSGDSIDLNGKITYGVCANGPTAGMPCDHGDCATGLSCDGSTCAAPRADGAACTLDEQCTSNGCNDDAQGRGTCGVRTTCDGK